MLTKYLPKYLPLSAIGIAAAIALSGCGTGAANHGAMGHAAETSQGPSGSGDATASGDHNAADTAFAQMMTPHHAQAVEMSDLLLAKQDIPAPVVELATRIKAEQGPEIEQMTGWLRGWGQSAMMSPGGGGMDHSMNGQGMAGMMSEQDLQALRDAQGSEAARLFLQQMIAHHEGAIVMAKTYTPTGQNAAAVSLSEAIITTQKREIAEMRDLLAGL